MPAKPIAVVGITQGDPAGIGPEIILRAVSEASTAGSVPLLFLERAAIEPLKSVLPAEAWGAIRFVDQIPERAELESSSDGTVFAIDPVGESRRVTPGSPGAADAVGAMTAIDAAVEAVGRGAIDAILTAPVSKASIAEHHLPSFRGHTEYLAEGAGLEVYGRDYLMAFLAPDLQVALLSTHLPLVAAIAAIEPAGIATAAACLARHTGGKIAVPGINPHAGEGGLLGREDEERVRPGVELARAQGLDVCGPESPDSIFARAREGYCDWVLALYHDQGLIAVKTAAFGTSTNWTVGLPYLRTSVDHGTAFDIAGRGVADAKPLVACLETTARLMSGDLPRRST